MSMLILWIVKKFSIPAPVARWIVLVVGTLLAMLALWLAATVAVNAIRNDAQNDLRIEQAEERQIASDAQRDREATAAATRTKDLAAGANADAAQQEEMTNATQNLPDTRPSARQRARICIDLQQQDKAAGRTARSC